MMPSRIFVRPDQTGDQQQNIETIHMRAPEGIKYPGQRRSGKRPLGEA